MDGMDGWDGRLSSSASLLRAPYGANKFEILKHYSSYELNTLGPLCLWQCSL